MANAHGHILATIWRDRDFQRLGMAPQWLYMQLLSSPDRNLCGVVPYTPRRWQAGARGVTLADIDKAVGALSETRFVLVDDDTDELLVRTVVKHDPPRNPNVTVGMWRQWERIASERVRAAIVAEMPAEVWLRAPLAVPLEAHILAGHGPSETSSD